MIDFVKMLVARVWVLVDGKKTYAAAAIALVLAANEAVRVVYEKVLLTPQWEQTVMMLAVALGVSGVAHKYDKSRDAMVAIAEAVAALERVAKEREVAPVPADPEVTD